MTNVKSLLEMYVKMGGSLTDTYSDIAGGVPVGQYSTISDAILACSKKYSAGGGGGAEKFVVTLTEENDTWTADESLADIFAAKQAGKEVVAAVTYETVPTELSATVITNLGSDAEPVYLCLFSGLALSENQTMLVYLGQNNGESDEWVDMSFSSKELPSYSSSNNGQVLGVSSGSLAWVDTNAPLIVTLTAGQTEGQFVGDKTYKEVYDAFIAGQNCILNIPDAFVAVAVLAVGHETGYTISASNEISAAGSANDYITITVGG